MSPYGTKTRERWVLVLVLLMLIPGPQVWKVKDDVPPLRDGVQLLCAWTWAGLSDLLSWQTAVGTVGLLRLGHRKPCCRHPASWNAHPVRKPRLSLGKARERERERCPASPVAATLWCWNHPSWSLRHQVGQRCHPSKSSPNFIFRKKGRIIIFSDTKLWHGVQHSSR